jgi:TonB family protein
MTSDGDLELTPVFTLVVWAGCLCVGTLGSWLRDTGPQPPARAVPPVEARLVNVQIAPASPLPPEAVAPMATASPAPISPPPPPEAPSPPPAPIMAVLATPSVPIAPAQAVPMPPPRPVTARPAQAAAPGPPPEVELTTGEIGVVQPPPDYPYEAAVNREQGDVVVRIHVGADGSVLEAKVISACPWPVLNQEALRNVRDDYRFPPGRDRYYVKTLRWRHS